MSIARIMQQAAAGAGEEVVLPEGVTFDGTNDFLRNAYSSAGRYSITHSFWFYVESTGSAQDIYSRVMTNGQDNIRIRLSGNILTLAFYNSNGGQQLAASFSLSCSPRTWNHLVYSGSFASPGNQIQVYLNDVSQGNLTLTNDALASTEVEYVARIGGTRGNISCAHMYIKDGTIDLSVEANRRNFITADLKPAAGQGSYSSPRTYLPMIDAATVGVNEGSHPNWTLTGTISGAGRGPNQYNSPATRLDGSNDHLSRTSLTGSTEGKVFTTAFSVKLDDFNTDGAYLYVFSIKQTGSVRFGIRFDTSGNLQLFGANSGGATRLLVLAGRAAMGFAANKYIHVAASIDLTDSAKRRLFINGESVTLNISDYQDDNLDFVSNEYYIGSRDNTGEFLHGELSDFWFDTTYIDLATDNPFYDSELGETKFLGVSGEIPTGSAPLIYLPLRANDPGNNLGTGGTFTVNSGPFTAARSPSEHWANLVNIDTDAYLQNTSFSATSSKAFSLVLYQNWDSLSSGDGTLLYFTTTGGSERLRLWIDVATGRVEIQIRNSTGSVILKGETTTYHPGGNKYYMFSANLENSSQRHLLVNGVDDTSSWATYTNDNMDFSGVQNAYIGRDAAGSNKFDGRIGHLWFDNTYIDFSQESNRLKFWDAFGYPAYLGEDGSLPTGSQPLIYMNKDIHLGTNLGSSGDFTPVSDGADTITDRGFLEVPVK